MSISLSTIRYNLLTGEALFPSSLSFFPVGTKYRRLLLRQKNLSLLSKETACGPALVGN